MPEAATSEGVAHRQNAAPELFYGVYEEGDLIGFVSGTATNDDTLEEDMPLDHGPENCGGCKLAHGPHGPTGLGLCF